MTEPNAPTSTLRLVPKLAAPARGPRMVQTNRGPVSADALELLEIVNATVQQLVTAAEALPETQRAKWVAQEIDRLQRSGPQDSKAVRQFCWTMGKHMRTKARALFGHVE